MQKERIKAEIMDEAAVNRALTRMAHEIAERNHGTEDIVLVGVLRRGKALAQRLAKAIERFEGVEIPCGELDIDHYRDDLGAQRDMPILHKAELPFSIVNRKVVLVDDVLYTGRTVRAAIEAIFALGRPRAIQLAILIDRGHRELPIRADYVGKSIPTSHQEEVSVRIPPYDEQTAVVLLERE
ncbi:MAG: bifunctional pyr operon transcriptional regulator/uracil phosphoribosyltransferase PyrR [Eubacteriales bacterium]|nr:bifunctional pyr operon transcriptional regulator/uracil phosphoribosyltransferase PyrR [Eubacteriales bacterium]